MEQRYLYNPGLKGKHFFKGFVVFLIIIYLLNCFSPLRLHVDMLRYFAIKDCIEFGCPPISEAAKDYLPYGYTGLLLILSKIGLLNSFTIVLINCIFLFCSLYLIKGIFNLTGKTYLFFVLVLLNWTIIKFTTHPLSEMQYLFFSTSSLYFFCKFTKTKNFISLLYSFLSAGLAFLTRSVGVALAAALFAGVIWQYRRQLLSMAQKNKVLLVAIVIIITGIAFFSKQLGLNHYTDVFSKQFDEGVGLIDIFNWHFTEWSELFFNTSQSKVPAYIPSSITQAGFIIAGIIFLLLFAYFLVRNKNIPFVIKVYLLFYCILMFNWPFYDPRFWVPVIPLMVIVIMQGALPLPKFFKYFASVALPVYIVMGLLSVGYITYTTFNKRSFANTQANGAYKNEYEIVFFGKPQSDTAIHINEEALHVIERYSR